MDRTPRGKGSPSWDIAVTATAPRPLPTDTQIGRWARMLAEGELTAVQYEGRVSQLRALVCRSDREPDS